MKKTIASILVAMILLMQTSLSLGLSAQSSVLIDAHNGRILMENNSYDRLGMASTTKIMTAIVALEQAELDEIVTVSAKAASMEGTSVWLAAGEKAKMEDLLYALLLNSGNDAATAIAEHVSGSVEKFSDVMNQTAQKIGVKSTRFTNPHGLYDPNHYTTAYDLAQITRYALQNETFAKIVATKTKTIPREGYEWGRKLTNHNKMLVMYEGADGVKTGFTKKTGRTLVSSATRNEMQLIAVTLNAPNDWNDHTEMLDYGFSNYSLVNLLPEGLHIRSFPAKDGYIGAVVGEDLVAVLKESEQERIEYEYDIPEQLPKNLKNGDKLGAIKAVIGKEVVGETILVVKTHATTNEQREERSFTEIYRRLWRNLSTQS